MNDHTSCSGCSLCLLVCPMWRKQRNISFSAHGYAKALQHGASASDLAEALWSCSMCGACDSVCPEQIDLTGMILKLRRQLEHPEAQNLQARMEAEAALPLKIEHQATKLLPDQTLRESPELLVRISDLLRSPIAEDDGVDISLALEAGVIIPQQRLQRFLSTCRGLKKIIVADGLLLKHLKQLLPKINFVTLGEALSTNSMVRRKLCASDLYVIDVRCYHTDYEYLVKHYDHLRADSGCTFNLDLQRIAIPATSRSLAQRLGLLAQDDDEQARWLLHGRSINRIVVESLEDKAAIEKISEVPVVHLMALSSSP